MNYPTKRFVVFDIDGTLIDSNDFHAKAWQYALAIFDKHISFARIRSQMGKGSDQFLPTFLKPFEIKAYGKELTELRETIFKKRFLQDVRPFPKVRELFRKIKRINCRIALASSSNKEEVQKYMEIANIQDLVDVTTSSDDAQSSKPQPDIFQAAVRKLHSPAKESILVVGDTPYDALAASKAKLAIIGVLCGGFRKKNLLTNGCQAIYKNPADILANLEKILKS